MVGCAAAAASYYAAKAAYERYFTLADYRDALMPPAGEDLSGRRKYIFTWHPRGLNLDTLENLRNASTRDRRGQVTENLNECRLIQALKHDCVAFNIFPSADLNSVLENQKLRHTLAPITSGKITWDDVIATLNYEICKLTNIKEYLRKASRWRIFPGDDRYTFGAERDLANTYRDPRTFQQQGQQNPPAIIIQEDERQMSTQQENAVTRIMTQPISTSTRIIAAVLGAPNFDETYSLYWMAYRRLLWLETLKGIVERAAGSHDKFGKIFVDVREHAAFELDQNGHAQIIAPLAQVRVPAQGAQAPHNAAHQNGH